MSITETMQQDRAYFDMHKTKLEYVRPPLPNEFAHVAIPANARVRVYLINQRSLVKVLELPDGERLATIIDVSDAGASNRKAA